MMPRSLPLPLPLVRLLLLLSAALPAAVPAAEISCPSLADAAQVASCPTEDELLFTFNGYCSDNARIYGKGAEVCTDYQLYRKRKNVALWETADGAFHAYVSCDLSPAAVKQARVAKISVGKDGKMTRLACSYGEDITFSHRRKASCRVDNAEACRSDAAACKATCD